jgi:hypothetical protein
MEAFQWQGRRAEVRLEIKLCAKISEHRRRKAAIGGFLLDGLFDFRAAVRKEPILVLTTVRTWNSICQKRLLFGSDLKSHPIHFPPVSAIT